MKQHNGTQGQRAKPEDGSPYVRLGVMAALSFVAMFALMYSMVDRMANVVPNLNQAYMAGLMTAPMLIIELIVMRGMYPNRKVNMALLTMGVAVLATCWGLIRTQSGISDRQFLSSMIPHHAGAILMCKEAKLEDPEVQQLCGNIVSSQQEEIAFMKGKLGGVATGRDKN